MGNQEGLREKGMVCSCRDVDVDVDTDVGCLSLSFSRVDVVEFDGCYLGGYCLNQTPLQALKACDC